MVLAETSTDLSSFVGQLVVWGANALPNIVAAVLLLIAGFWLGGLAARSIERFVKQQGRVDPMLKSVLSSLARYIVLAVTLVAVLSQLGIQTTSILAALGAIGLAIGLALQGTLSNIAAGVMLLWLRPFRNGDFIDYGDTSGTVQEVGLFATKFRTLEGVFVFVPNNELWNTRLTNYSHNDTRMIREVFGISYDDDISKARRTLLSAAAQDERILSDPEPKVLVTTLGDNSVSLEVRAWTRTPDWASARFDFIENGKIGLDRAGITIPFPQRDLHLRTMSGDVTEVFANGGHDARPART